MDGMTLMRLQAIVREVPIAEPVLDYATRLVLATHPEGTEGTNAARRYVRYGASPRAAQAMILAGKALALLDGRYHVAAEDVAQVALPALNHRIIRNFHGEMEQVSTGAIVEGIVAASGGRA